MYIRGLDKGQETFIFHGSGLFTLLCVAWLVTLYYRDIHVQQINDLKTFSSVCRDMRFSGLSTALVPTMGFFHEGHLSLMRYARKHADRVMVSLFVNPAQFGPTEDLDAYPRDLEHDARAASEAGVDILFTPQAPDMYTPDHASWVEVPSLSSSLCGASRPGHFRGVCTIVMKLLLLSLPTFAVFGEKDRQQLIIIQRMVEDLHVPTRIEGRPIVREADGLAMSSRNVYLEPAEREQAANIYQGLQFVQESLFSGIQDTATLTQRLKEYYERRLPSGKEDYLSFVDPKTLEPVDVVSQPTLLAVAVYLGRARLIDNCILRPSSAAVDYGHPPD